MIKMNKWADNWLIGDNEQEILVQMKSVYGFIMSNNLFVKVMEIFLLQIWLNVRKDIKH